FGCPELGDLWIHQTRAGPYGVGRMQRWGVIGAQCRGNPTLCQGGISRRDGIMTKPTGGHQGDVDACADQAVDRRQTGDASANNDNHGRAANMRSSATSASAATDGSTEI